ncbi:trypsin-like peptidase domain-containing protein [Kitasatospora purpeofusca]|uniref:trypsin-like peptidase domain-containing protein n=1 Tax=Kitasatospora purpeofusca TaxID=67352 RepID=UPI0035E225A0
MAWSAVVGVGAGSSFLGSGFLIAPGLVVTAAHVARRSVGEAAVDAVFGRVPVRGVRLFPAAPGPGRFHAFPDLALLALAVPVEPPEIVVDLRLPPAGSEVVVAGCSPYTPTPGVQRDSLLLTVAGPSGGYVRVTGDEVRDGFSGGMVVRPDTGAVCGVLKGSRAFDGVRGGWFTPLGALADVLAPDDPLRARLSGQAVVDPGPRLPSARDLVPVLLRVRDMDDPDFRRSVVRTAGDLLGDPGPLHVAYRAHAGDHVLELVQACLQHRDPAAALEAVVGALGLLRPGLAAVEELRLLVAGAEGGS